jgi:hypothetical protein
MNKKQKDLKLQQIKDILCSKGWTEDRYGNFKLQQPTKIYRVKIQDISIRYELQWTRADNSKDWVNLRSDYLKNVEIIENNIKIKDVLL